MRWKGDPDRYGRLAVVLHWLSAAAIVALFATGFVAADMLDPAAKANLLRFHLPLGAVVMALTLARLGWWLVDVRPAMAAGVSAFQARAARTVHALLYVVVLGVAVSGVALTVVSGAGAILFAGAPGPLPDLWDYPPRIFHGAGARLLFMLLGLHVGAALYHQLVMRDRILARMSFRPARLGNPAS